MKKKHISAKNFTMIILVLTVSLIIPFTGSGVIKKGDSKAGVDKYSASSSSYNPAFWLDGGFDSRKRTVSKDSLYLILEDLNHKGWNGITYRGAQMSGRTIPTMNYYFKSAYLETQPWANLKNDGLSPLIDAAHKNGIKVMINLEGVNPYHWEANKWTPENIRPVVDDLASTGVDMVFDECFDRKPEVFTPFADELVKKGITYICGRDPKIVQEPQFVDQWSQTSVINMYHYYLKRDKAFTICGLAQTGSIGYGWAKFWGKPTSLISPLAYDWGIATDYSPAVVPYMCMIRALQFRVDNFMIWGAGLKTTFDPAKTREWIEEYTSKQEKDRPLMDIIVLLKKKSEFRGDEKGDQGWNNLFVSSDAITSGASNAGYNIIVSDKVVPADAYWIFTRGGNDDVLPEDVVSLFSTEKPVFIQCSTNIPGGPDANTGWKSVLAKCGVDADKAIAMGGRGTNTGVSPRQTQESDIPYTGYYKDVYLRFTAFDVFRGQDLRTGTVIPKEAITGEIYCSPNKTYSRGPFIVGNNNKFLVTPTAISWEVSYPISDLLSGGGVLPTSNVWGIVGKKVTALLAVETTELQVKIPGLPDGSMIHVVIWDKLKNKKLEETVTYTAPYKHILDEYDLILIDAV